MEPIDLQTLSTVRGGFGAILGALLQSAPSIISSISGLVSASKGGSGQTAVAQGQPPAAAPTGAPAQPASPTQMASAPSGGSSPCSCCSGMLGPSVQNFVRIG